MGSNLYKYLPQRLRLPDDTMVNSITRAVDDADERVMELIQACIGQLFLTTASGKFLVQLGEQEGFVMPPNSGLDLRAYRVLVPLMVAAPKQVRSTINDVIEAFYGSERTRPSITAAITAPYNLNDGEDLIVTTDQGTINVTFLSDKIADIHNVGAPELAAIINSVQNLVYADTVTDRSTALQSLRLSSYTVGAGGSIRITGGTLQNILKFPRLVDTQQQVGTTWLISKEQAYTDVMRFDWDGVGFNPRLYLIKKGDFVTIRNPGTTLHGSFEIIDCGYDYFVVRNPLFVGTAYTLVQVAANDVVFTSRDKVTIYDNSEYGMTSETLVNVASVTVPAIPPLTRRFLSGSAHLHGGEYLVQSFSRNAIKLSLPIGGDAPVGDNSFVIKNDTLQYDFCDKRFKTTNSDGAASPTYFVVSDNTNYASFPYTVPTLISPDAIHAEVGATELSIAFPFAHGLKRGWEFILGNAAGIANISAGMLNRAHVVADASLPNRIVVTLKDVNGIPVIFEGVGFGPFDIRRLDTILSDGSDFCLEFADNAAVIASGLEVGMTFKVDPASGSDLEAFYADAIKHRILSVASIDGNKVNIVSGLGAGNPYAIIDGAMGYRSATFGGTSATYMLDQSSPWNQKNIMSGLKVCPTALTPCKNTNYKGSFLFDPLGTKTLHTLSRFVAKSSTPILRGSNLGIIFVDSVDNVFGVEPFPTSGQLILDYGTDGVEGPINYIATISSTTGASQILIDPSYRFIKSHAVSASVQFVHANTPYAPGLTGEDFPAYVTGTSQSRKTLFTLIEDLIAAGVFLEANVLLPSLRYADTSIPPFE
jgi:hypothetical protein